MRIVVVEDEPAIADFLVRGLEAAGYSVALATDGPGGEKLILEGEADLAVLDLMLPGRDGLEVLRAIRRVRPLLPVIILSARGEVEDRIAGLDSGATDYMTKPFSVPELLARVRAHLRTGGTEAGRLRAGGIELDLLSRRVWSAGREVALSPREFSLLACFARHPGEALSRDRLLAEAWGYEHDPGTNVVDVYVGYLRRKLGDPKAIETVRSTGYRLAAGEPR
jgi:two-component system, OmpR family, response regulator